VSRFLVSIEAAGLPLTLALNKADLVDEAEVAARLAQCAAWGYPAVAISCASGRGLAELGGALAGKTSVVAGPSGAGKSSLINALRLGRHKEEEDGDEGEEEAWEGAAALRLGRGDMADAAGVHWVVANGSGGCAEEGEEAAGSRADSVSDTAQEQRQARAASGAAAGTSGHGGGGGGEFLAVGDVSKLGRGKHTTRVVRLIPLPGGGLMADTPGFGLPTLDGISSAELGSLFPEFRAAGRAAPGGGCRFDDCMHVAEPGCAVSGGGLERYPHYLKFLAEVKVGRGRGSGRGAPRARGPGSRSWRRCAPLDAAHAGARLEALPLLARCLP
jgi:ribosome biogenesis GTPase